VHPVDEQLSRPGGLAERLFRVRKAAGLTGEQLATALGWEPPTGRTKVSKIENGKQTPGPDEIRAWAEACGHPELAPELLDLLADVQTVHTRWRRRIRGGHAAIQQDIDRRTQAATRIRNAEVSMIPGLLQTAGYARSIITAVSAAYGTTDVDAAVQARMRRQDVLYDQSKTFEFVITEAALRLLPCPPQVMAGQLDRLMSMDLPNVTLGIVPFGTELAIMPYNSFLLLDDALTVETWAGKDEDAGDESAVHVRVFDLLVGEALTGESARHLIAAAAASLRDSLASCTPDEFPVPD
jgi:transcriptional regulator with XRE-family HTH domain